MQLLLLPPPPPPPRCTACMHQSSRGRSCMSYAHAGHDMQHYSAAIASSRPEQVRRCGRVVPLQLHVSIAILAELLVLHLRLIWL